MTLCLPHYTQHLMSLSPYGPLRAPTRRTGRRPRTEEERHLVRARLLAAIIACVREHRPHVSVDELARAAGVSKPVLYDQFGDRRGITAAVAGELADLIERDVWASLAASSPPEPSNLVRGLVASVLDLVGDDTNLYHFAVQDLRASGAGLLDNPLAARLHARASVVLAVSWPSLDVATLSILVDGLFGFLLTATESWLARGRHTARDSLVEPLSAALLAGWATAASTDGRVWPS